MSLVRVTAGEFTMGSRGDDPGVQSKEKPQHNVRLDEYLIGKYQVTVAQFRAFVDATGYSASSNALRTGKDNYPVNCVSWDDATTFCLWASQVTGRAVRLPTEAEWEKAARGTDGRIYPWGNQTPDSSRCNFNENEGGTRPVGKYRPKGDSPYGCADMAGNVFEWVNDWYADDYYASSPCGNPPGPTSGLYRVKRGGGWVISAVTLRSTYRSSENPDYYSHFVGFRCAVSPGI